MMRVKRVGWWLVAGALAFGGAACTTMRPVELTGRGALPAAIEAGARINVLDTGGATTDLVVTTAGTDFIEGVTEGDQPVRIAAADVLEIRERRPAPGKNAALGVGVAFALFLHSLDGWAVWAGP